MLATPSFCFAQSRWGVDRHKPANNPLRIELTMPTADHRARISWRARAARLG